MHIPKSVFPTAVVAVALGLASPVLAQHRRGGGDGGHSSSSNRGSESHGQAMPRAAQPPASRPAQAPAPAPAPAQRSDNGARRDSWGGAQPRAQGAAVPRAYPSVRNGGAYRNGGNQNYGNQNYGNQNYGNQNYGNRSYGYSSHNYSYRGYGHYSRPPVHFYHPYYSFRPRFSIGFGLWVGYPVPYAYSYYDPFYYGYNYPYPTTVYPSNPYPASPYPAYPPTTSYPQSAQTYPQTVPDPNSIGVQQGQANLGGLSFDLTPSDAQVLVDGNFVGTVDQFSPSSQPLGLSAGRHRVEVEAQGYRTLSFDVDIIAGQVLPYQGAMERR
jgi:hypothetical protein